MDYQEFSAREQLLAYCIGEAVLKYLRNEDTIKQLLTAAETKSMEALEEIQSLLNNDVLDDPNCFNRVEELVRIFEKYHISTSRHDF